MTAGGGSRKAGLNWAILDVGMADLIAKLTYKAEEAGTRLVEVATLKVKPSQTCLACLRRGKKPLSQHAYSCPCGCVMPRDQASAQVMLPWAIHPWEPGGGEEPKSGSVEARNPDQTANAVGRG
jgi:putative transposase